MSNEESYEAAVAATKAALRERGANVGADGKVKSISSSLDDIAQQGGGVVDQETAVAWSLRIKSGEDTIMALSRELVEWTGLLKSLPLRDVPTEVVQAFATSQVKALADAVTRFIYGVSEKDLVEALQPMSREIYGRDLEVPGPPEESAE